MTPGYYLATVDSRWDPLHGQRVFVWVVDAESEGIVTMFGDASHYMLRRFKDWQAVDLEATQRVQKLIADIAVTQMRFSLDVAAAISKVGALTNENYQRFWVGDEPHQLHVDAERKTTLVELQRWLDFCNANGRDFC